jgi:hypothetical protein
MVLALSITLVWGLFEVVRLAGVSARPGGFSSPELHWQMDVFGVLGEFRSGFRSFRAFRRRSESPQPLWGSVQGYRQLRVWAISVTRTCVNRAEFQCLTSGLTSHHA